MKFMSGQFIYLPWFLSHRNKNLEQWTKRCRTSDKLQLSSAQADRSFLSKILPKEPSSSFLLVPLGYPFMCPASSFWLCLIQSRACTHHQSTEGCKWSYTQGHLTVSSYITAGCVVMPYHMSSPNSIL